MGALALHRTRKRVHSRGWDPTLQGIGGLGNPNADMLMTGLRVPYQAQQPAGDGTSLVQRYLFQLCSVGIGRGLWLVGLGQLSVLGSEQQPGGVAPTPPTFPNVLEQTSSAFRFSDCLPIRWGVRRVRKPKTQWTGQNTLSTNSFAWRWTDTSALLYETATFPAADLDWKGTPDNYLTLTAYAAPGGGGIFPGTSVGGSLGSFDSLDFPYSNPGRKAFEPIWVEGEGSLVFYALVDQTAPGSRATIQVPAMFPLPPTGMPENAFIGNWTSTLQYSVGGWMETEQRDDDARDR